MGEQPLGGPGRFFLVFVFRPRKFDAGGDVVFPRKGKKFFDTKQTSCQQAHTPLLFIQQYLADCKQKADVFELLFLKIPINTSKI